MGDSDDGGYSDDSGEDSDYHDGGGDNSIEEDKYISDSEESEGEKKRKRPAKGGAARPRAPAKKKNKVATALPRNNVGSYQAEWVSKKSFKTTIPKSTPTTSISAGPKTFLSLTSEMEKKRLQLNASKSPNAEGRLASVRQQPGLMNFFSKLDQFKFVDTSKSSPVATRTSIPIVAPASLSSPEKDLIGESPIKKPFSRDTSTTTAKYSISDSEKEEEPQKMTNIKKKRNKALVMSDDESDTPSSSFSSASANKENIKTASSNSSSSPSPISISSSSSASPSSASPKTNGKPPTKTLSSFTKSTIPTEKSDTKESKPDKTDKTDKTDKPDKPDKTDKTDKTDRTEKDKSSTKTESKKEVNEFFATNGNGKHSNGILADDDVVVLGRNFSNSAIETGDESDGEVVVTGASKPPSTVTIPEDEDEDEEEEMDFGIDSIIKSCENFSRKMMQVLSGWNKQKDANGMVKMPTILHCPLRSYQLIGLNWLALLYEQNMCGILADEMGLGKTVQTISLLAHLLERKNNEGPHIIVVPSTTLSNWAREFSKWCPTMSVFTYYGSQKERESQRITLRSARSGVYNVILTTYNMAYGKYDRPFLKKFNWQYMILDEAHNIKNSESTRYQHLLKIKSEYRLLLTGTPLQNNLTELWSLLNFLMPKIFGRPKEADSVFQQLLNSNSSQSELLSRMKKILSPFILRRLKSEVSGEIKPKIDVVEKCKMPPFQKEKYTEMLKTSKKMWTQRNIETAENGKAKTAAKKRGRKKKTDDADELADLEDAPPLQGSFNLLNNMLMQMRKMANHPLLCRSFYTQEQILTIRDILKQSDPEYIDEKPEYILEDLEMASDYDLHMLCADNPLLTGLKLSDEQLFESAAKMVKLKQLLKELKENGNRVLMFSQMTKVLDILELFLEHEGYKFVRLDGSTAVNERQDIIDDYNKDHSIFIFLLSTRAGGMGINLTSAETVIFYDISFNPQVDKQAEDRCHRLGQEKQVKVIKLIADDTVDQYMLQLSEQKKELHDSMLEEGAFEKEKGSKMEAKKLLKLFDSLFNNLPQE